MWCVHSRIYYLFQGPTRITRFEEDRILSALFWLSPSVSGAVTLLHMGENFIFHGENPWLFNYRDTIQDVAQETERTKQQLI